MFTTTGHMSGHSRDTSKEESIVFSSKKKKKIKNFFYNIFSKILFPPPLYFMPIKITNSNRQKATVDSIYSPLSLTKKCYLLAKVTRPLVTREANGRKNKEKDKQLVSCFFILFF